MPSPASSTKQIFQTPKRTRWLSVLWLMRLMVALLITFVSVFVLNIVDRRRPKLPRLSDFNKEKALHAPDKLALATLFEKSKLSTVKRKTSTGIAIKFNDTLPNNNPVRSAFYVPWDPLSFLSLKKNISRLSHIIPEWFSLSNNSDGFNNKIDARGLALMRAFRKPVFPLLSNSDGQDFSEKLFEKHCATDSLRKQCVQQILRLLNQYHFQGINIDFEEISEKNKQAFILFQKELYETLHPLGFQVSMDVPVFNDSYDCALLQLYNDYIFAMAYDENNSASEAGPVAEEQWMEDAIMDLLEEVPGNKLVLCMPTYGYDWAEHQKGESLTYYEALNLAKQYQKSIHYNNNNYNLDFSYDDTVNNVFHEVYFTDACTNFNALRFSEDNGLAGSCIWRLGGEDPRLWNFYSDRLDNHWVSVHREQYASSFQQVENSSGISYIGEGDILDVLSVPEPGKIKIEMDTVDNLIGEQEYVSLPSGFVVRKFGKSEKKIVLTFDDGPDEEYTPQILKILQNEKVPAAFFVVGMHVQDNLPIVEKMYSGGFEIGNHTLTHANMSEVSTQRAEFETSATRKLIEIITGHSTILFRPPYNADSQPETQEDMIPVARCKNENYYTIAESIDPTDWKEGSNADSIYNRVISQLKNGNIILLHDAGGNRTETIKALPKIIRSLKNMGYQFTTVADLLGKTSDEVMPNVVLNNRSAYWNMKLNYFFTKAMYAITHSLAWLFLIGVVLSVFRSLFILFFATKNYSKKNKPVSTGFKPFVSVLIPAFNEEVNIVRTIQSVLQSEYDNYEVIVIDDGSNDATYWKAQQNYGAHQRVKIIKKPNEGKASALNTGIMHARHELILCIDADSQLHPKALAHAVTAFIEDNVGAVAGNVVVGNEVNLLTHWQNIEYVTSQNFDRRAFDELNCISVVPGAIGVFRKKAIVEAGYYTGDTLAEDCDLTIRIRKAGYRIINNNQAISFTESPETFSMFLKQRFRWNFGVMQAFWKNRNLCFNWKYGSLGLIAMPNILIFQILLPILAPFADMVLLWALINGNTNHVLQSYLIFTIADLFSALAAFYFQKENFSKLIWFIPQRLVYRQLMYFVLFHSVYKALKGETHVWGKLERTGHFVLK